MVPSLRPIGKTVWPCRHGSDQYFNLREESVTVLGRVQVDECQDATPRTSFLDEEQRYLHEQLLDAFPKLYIENGETTFGRRRVVAV